jgi:phage shock protein C
MTASPDINQPPVVPPAPTATTRPPRILRSRTNRVFAGVCGGLAETYGSDPTAVRLLAAILAVITGIFPMLLVYLVAAIVIPEHDDGTVPADASASPRTITPIQGGLVVGIVLVGVGVLAFVNEWYGIDWSMLWPVALLVFGVALIASARR